MEETMVETTAKEIIDPSKTSISEDEAALYDRQIRLWGLDAQKRLRASRVLLVGLNGLGAEICKNIVLCGVKSLTLLDHEQVTEQDFTAQFLIPRSDLGKNRANACLTRAQKLNPMVEITSDPELVMKKPKDYFKKFNVVILTGCSQEVMVHVNQVCHDENIKFYAADVFGYFGYSFGDLVDHKYVEEQKTPDAINLTVRASSSKSHEGPPEKKAKQEESTTIMVEKFLKFCPIKDALDASWVESQTPKSLKKICSVFFILQVLLKFQETHGRNPQGTTSMEDGETLLKLRDNVFETLKINTELVPDEFASHCLGILSPTSSIVGGILAQDVVKGGVPTLNELTKHLEKGVSWALSGKDAPLNNFFFFNGLTGEGVVECFHGNKS